MIVTRHADAPADLSARARAVVAAHGCLAGARGSVAYLFHPVGLLSLREAPGVAEAAWAAGAEDVRSTGTGTGDCHVTTDPAELDVVRERLAAAGHRASRALVTRRAGTTVALDGDAATRLGALVAALQALDGVAAVYTNAALP